MTWSASILSPSTSCTPLASRPSAPPSITMRPTLAAHLISAPAAVADADKASIRPADSTSWNRVGAPGFPGQAIQHREYCTVGRSRRHFRADESIPAQRRLEKVIVESTHPSGREPEERQRAGTPACSFLPMHRRILRPNMCKGHQVRESASVADAWHCFQPERLQHVCEAVHEPRVVSV